VLHVRAGSQYPGRCSLGIEGEHAPSCVLRVAVSGRHKRTMVCQDRPACISISIFCLCGSFFCGLFVWRHGVISAQADVQWTAGECEVLSGTFREQTGGEKDIFYVSFNTRFYHDRTDIESPFTVLSNEWGHPDHGATYSDVDWQAAERRAESYRRSIIDCCGDPGSGSVWGYEDSATCAATPKCSQTHIGNVEDALFLGGLGKDGVHTFGCELCLECCSSMTYAADASTYTGYTLTGAYKRRPCYARTEEFDVYVQTAAQDRDGLLWVRLHPVRSLTLSLSRARAR
jgi:hypothetical protein